MTSAGPSASHRLRPPRPSPPMDGRTGGALRVASASRDPHTPRQMPTSALPSRGRGHDLPNALGEAYRTGSNLPHNPLRPRLTLKRPHLNGLDIATCSVWGDPELGPPQERGNQTLRKRTRRRHRRITIDTTRKITSKREASSDRHKQQTANKTYHNEINKPRSHKQTKTTCPKQY